MFIAFMIYMRVRFRYKRKKFKAMNDYTVLKSSREELLKKAGYAEPHVLFNLAVDRTPPVSEMSSEQNSIAYPAGESH